MQLEWEKQWMAVHNFPFAVCVAFLLRSFHALHENECQNLSESSLLLFFGWQFWKHSEFSKTSGFLAFLFWFRRCRGAGFNGTVFPAQNWNRKMTLKSKRNTLFHYYASVTKSRQSQRAYIQHRDSRCNNFFGKSPWFSVVCLVVFPLFVAQSGLSQIFHHSRTKRMRYLVDQPWWQCALRITMSNISQTWATISLRTYHKSGDVRHSTEIINGYEISCHSSLMERFYGGIE